MAWETSNRKERLPGNWLSLRKQAFDLYGRQCYVVENGVRCAEEATDIDHVKHGDDHSLDNLRPICRRHHKTKSSSEGWEALRRQKRIARARAEKKFGHNEEHPGKSPGAPFHHPWVQ